MSNSTNRLRFNFWLNMDKPEEELIADKIEVLKNERGFTAAIRDGIRLICDLKDGKLDVLFELFPWVRAEFLEYMREVTHEASPPTEQPPAPQPSSPQIAAERAWLEAEQERIKQERAWEQRRIEEAQQALEAEKQAIEQERKRIETERQQSQSAIQKQLDRLEELLLQQGNVPIQAPNGSGVGLQPITLDNPSGPKTINVPQFSSPTFDDDEEDTRLEVKRDKAAGDIAVQNFLKSAIGLQEHTQ